MWVMEGSNGCNVPLAGVVIVAYGDGDNVVIAVAYCSCTGMCKAVECLHWCRSV